MTDERLHARVIDSTGIVLLRGGNFSGRTDELRRRSGLDAPDETLSTSGVYVRPEIYNSLSGLATTVDDELRLHSPEGKILDDVLRFWRKSGHSSIADQNPNVLSGGEQALVAVMAALCLDARVLAFDSTFEQMSPELRRYVLDELGRVFGARAECLVADNRIAEYLDAAAIRTIVDCGISREIAKDSGTREQYFAAVAAPPEFNPDGIPAILRPMRSCSLGVENVNFHYDAKRPVLSDVSFALAPDLYALEGANGAGKTTLARILSGVLRPASGQIRAGDEPVDVWQHPGQLVAYHFQNPDVQLFATRVDDEIGASVRAREDRLSVVGAIQHLFGLESVRTRHPLDLPFVLRKRVALAATVAMLRPWMIVDEPTLGQDDDAMIAIASILHELRDRGMGVIVISHSTSFKTRLAAKSLRLADGRLIT
jgi:energy-coupling factor transport system ATP-binding protein